MFGSNITEGLGGVANKGGWKHLYPFKVEENLLERYLKSSWLEFPRPNYEYEQIIQTQIGGPTSCGVF